MKQKHRNALEPCKNKAFSVVQKKQKIKVISGSLENVLKPHKTTVSAFLMHAKECVAGANTTRQRKK